MKKVKANMNRLSIRDFIAAVQMLIIRLTGNLNFPNLPNSTTAMNTAVGQLDTLQDQVDDGLKGASTQRDTKRVQVQDMVTANVEYANGTANGDEARLATTGLPFAKDRSAAPAPGAITKVTAENFGPAGSVLLRNNASSNRSGYVRQVTTDPSGGTWTDVVTTASPSSNRILVSGLTPGLTYYFKVAGVNKTAQGPWSDLAKVTIAA